MYMYTTDDGDRMTRYMDEYQVRQIKMKLFRRLKYEANWREIDHMSVINGAIYAEQYRYKVNK